MKNNRVDEFWKIAKMLRKDNNSFIRTEPRVHFQISIDGKKGLAMTDWIEPRKYKDRLTFCLWRKKEIKIDIEKELKRKGYKIIKEI